MENILQSIIPTSIIGIPFIPLLKDVFLGIFCLLIVLVFHGTCINHIIMRFETKTTINLQRRQYNRVFAHFYASFFFIALIHILEILMWTFFLTGLGLIPDGLHALLFVGSCYTTVGFVSDILPIGWKSLAFYISFTGLFSLAWTTSVMIGMTDAYKAAWNLKYDRNDQTES